jgi:hypothetical protein
MRKFIDWLQDWISHSSDIQTSEYLNKLARGPIFTVMTYQGYDINGYIFYTEQQDKKCTYQNSGVHVDAYNATSQNKNMYYGQIQEIWEQLVDGIKGVVQDKYGFISIDLNRQGYKSELFMLTKHVAQVLYVPNTTSKRLKMVIPRK